MCIPPAAGEREMSSNERVRESNGKETGKGKREVMSVKYRFVQ